MSPFALLVSPPHSDLIATGGSAAAAGELISKCGGKTLEYLFIVGLGFLNVSCKFLHIILSAVDSVTLVNLTLPGVCLIPCRETRSWTHLRTGLSRERIRRNLANFLRVSTLSVWSRKCTCTRFSDNEAIIEHPQSEQDGRVTTGVLV